jgi:hypothetical protein
MNPKNAARELTAGVRSKQRRAMLVKFTEQRERVGPSFRALRPDPPRVCVPQLLLRLHLAVLLFIGFDLPLLLGARN